ncbi:DUF932 domain-containing protein [Hydrogenovibrio marinus]|uniref:DUF945 domain-containing protein n=1 Tax=Hydrogenovibrio marinus TaxID=28885 RepID=A0A067A0T4_HYDMR|nr:DUF932 domain-containing protein [Hydrogenovibrio marinus]KDN96186.1 hypothetical protein EI16_07825 [Hydrogenovibrio marinus]BBN60636.1 hypothetical protein HVMH_2230 [Hydrogenovibrio marinus]
MSMNILTEQQLYRSAPAIFANSPDRAVSDRYGFVPTINIVHSLQNEGWYPVKALQTNTRNKARNHLTRHMIRFRQDPDRQILVGDSIAELILTNSHDRSSAYQLDLGLFRLVCSNGMVTQTGDLGNIRVRHGKQVVENIIEGSLQLAVEIPNLSESVEKFQSTLISKEEARVFAEAALMMRYGDNWKNQSPVSPEMLLLPRRNEDKEPSLWKIFNRVQENFMKGGLLGRSVNGRLTRTRAIKSVAEDVRLNRALWKLTEDFSHHKTLAHRHFLH